MAEPRLKSKKTGAEYTKQSLYEAMLSDNPGVKSMTPDQVWADAMFSSAFDKMQDQPSTQKPPIAGTPESRSHTPRAERPHWLARAAMNFIPDAGEEIARMPAALGAAASGAASLAANTYSDIKNEGFVKAAKNLHGKVDQGMDSALDEYTKYYMDPGLTERIAEHPARAASDLAAILSGGGAIMRGAGSAKVLNMPRLVSTGEGAINAAKWVDPVSATLEGTKAASRGLGRRKGGSEWLIEKALERIKTTDPLVKETAIKNIHSRGDVLSKNGIAKVDRDIKAMSADRKAQVSPFTDPLPDNDLVKVADTASNDTKLALGKDNNATKLHNVVDNTRKSFLEGQKIVKVGDDIRHVPIPGRNFSQRIPEMRSMSPAEMYEVVAHENNSTRALRRSLLSGGWNPAASAEGAMRINLSKQMVNKLDDIVGGGFKQKGKDIRDLINIRDIGEEAISKTPVTPPHESALAASAFFNASSLPYTTGYVVSDKVLRNPAALTKMAASINNLNRGKVAKGFRGIRRGAMAAGDHSQEDQGQPSFTDGPSYIKTNSPPVFTDGAPR